MTGPAPELADLRSRVDDVLTGFLVARRAELVAIHPVTGALVDELDRLLRAGGQRLRPAFVYWGFRAAGGPDGPEPVRAGAAVELLHTMALIHDDLMDGTAERRGVPATHEVVGPAVAILVGDLAAVFADQLLLESGLPGDRLLAAQARYHRMRLEMAAGQYLDVTGAGVDAHRAAALKGGAYTVREPLLLGAELAGGDPSVMDALARTGDPLGRAFQLLDDLRDGDAAPGVSGTDVDALLAEAVAALDPGLVGEAPAAALASLAARVGTP
jgi:geranylgeranyl diphosphate synthase type I